MYEGQRFVVERAARYLCEKLDHSDEACLSRAETCRRLNGGMLCAASTARDADCLSCLRTALRGSFGSFGSLGASRTQAIAPLWRGPYVHRTYAVNPRNVGDQRPAFGLVHVEGGCERAPLPRS